MRSKLGRLGVLAVAVAGLVGSGMSPAHASTSGTALFEGWMATGPLGYPCTPVGTTTNCLDPIDKSGQPTVGFFFNSNACTGWKLDVKPATKGIGGYGPFCQIRASGSVTGYCGLSLGSGSGTIGWLSPITAIKTVNFSFTFKGVGGTLVIIGTSNKGGITATIEVVPDPTQGSCSQGTQTGFLVTGEATLTGGHSAN